MCVIEWGRGGGGDECVFVREHVCASENYVRVCVYVCACIYVSMHLHYHCILFVCLFVLLVLD